MLATPNAKQWGMRRAVCHPENGSTGFRKQPWLLLFVCLVFLFNLLLAMYVRTYVRRSISGFSWLFPGHFSSQYTSGNRIQCVKCRCYFFSVFWQQLAQAPSAAADFFMFFLFRPIDTQPALFYWKSAWFWNHAADQLLLSISFFFFTLLVLRVAFYYCFISNRVVEKN